MDGCGCWGVGGGEEDKRYKYAGYERKENPMGTIQNVMKERQKTYTMTQKERKGERNTQKLPMKERSEAIFFYFFLHLVCHNC